MTEVGRPRKYKTQEDLQAAVDAYFNDLPQFTIGENKYDCATITGLALALGFCDRQSLYDYEKIPEFSCIIKKARLTIENHYEIDLKTKNSPTGAIFALKNMKWTDKPAEETVTPTQVNKIQIEVIGANAKG